MKISNNLLLPISPQVITNKQGKKIGVFIEIKDYDLLMERFEDLCLGRIAETIKQKKDKTVSLEDFKKKVVIKRK